MGLCLIEPMPVLFCAVCYYHFVMMLEDADSCQKQQVVKMMRTITFLPSGLSIVSSIDRCTDVEGIDQ